MSVRDTIATLIGEDTISARFAREVDASCRKLLGRPAELRELCLCIRDMPYKRPSRMADPDVILSEWRGTCSSKHILLVHLLRRLGIAANLYMGRYSIAPAQTPLPADLLRNLRRPEELFWDVHNYARADVNDASRLIDVTWPSTLAHHGFFRVTQRWDGRSDFRLAADVNEERAITPDADGLDAKKAWLEALNSEASARARREAFIVALSEFVEGEMQWTDREQTIHNTVAALCEEDQKVRSTAPTPSAY